MFKQTMTQKNSRLSPSSSQNRSVLQSRGEILLADYFTLPMINTQNSQRHSTCSSHIQPTSVNSQRINEKNMMEKRLNGQKIGIHRLTSKEEFNELNLSRDLIEKYNIPKHSQFESGNQYSRRSQVFGDEQPQVQRVRRPSLQITDSRIQVQKVTKLSKFLTNCFDAQVSEEKTDMTTESLKCLQSKFQRLNNNKYGTIPCIAMHYDAEENIQDEAKKYLIRKMKGAFKYVFAAMVISKQYKINKRAEKEQIVKLNAKLQECQREIGLYSQKQINAQSKEFVQNLTNKIFHYIKTPNYINQCILQDTQLGIDCRKTSIANFTRFFLQNLEFFTRENHIPKLFKCQLIASLYKTSKQSTSFFVGQRCHFYQSNRMQIPREQKVAIAMEYLLFEIIIPQLLKVIEDIPSLSINYKSETQNNMIGIASILHKLFVKNFESMRKIKNPNGNMLNNKLVIKFLDNDNISTEIIKDNSTGDNNIILDGLMSFQILEGLEEEKPSWQHSNEILFNKISQNLEQMLNF